MLHASDKYVLLVSVVTLIDWNEFKEVHHWGDEGFFSFSPFFIRLQFNKHGILREEGFLTPNKYDPEAISLWLPLSKNVVGLDLDTAKYILANIGDHFCQLVISEKEVMSTIEPHSKIN